MLPDRLAPRIAAETRLELPVIQFPPWMENALCREIGGDLFYDTANARAAQRICRRCPVISECREYGITEKHGIWGGTTAHQRRLARAKATSTERPSLSSGEEPRTTKAKPAATAEPQEEVA